MTGNFFPLPSSKEQGPCRCGSYPRKRCISMKKILSLVFLFALAAALCACSAPTVESGIDNSAQTTPTPVPSVNLADREMELYGPLPGEILLEELMADFAVKIQAGSAGSSLKAVAQAARLMDWGMDTAMTEEEIFAAVDFYLSALDEAALAEYMMQLSLLDSTYQQLLLPGQEALLETAGCADSRYPWTDMPIRCVESFFTAAGLRQTYQLPTSYEAEPADIYAPLARDYYMAFLDDWDFEYIEEKGLNATLIMEAAPYEPFSFLGYTSHDINGDGVPEFILGDMNAPTNVYEIATMIDGQFVSIFSGWSRNLGFICADGSVVVRGSGGAAITYYTYYKLDGGALKVFGSVIHEGNASPDAPWFISTDDDKDIMNDSSASEEQALGLIKQYEEQYISFELKPLSEAGDM